MHHTQCVVSFCREILEGEVESKASLLAEINVAEQTLQQITKETVQSAVEEFGVLVS